MIRAKKQQRNVSVIQDIGGNNIVVINDIRFKGKHFRENKESKHWRNAMYGWYRYDSRFAIPVYRDDEEVERYNIFHASLIVRYSEDGKLYLYDVIDIKKKRATRIFEN